MRGFKAFLLRGNVVDLAIAFVIGVAFSAVITAFVKDLVTPLIAAIGGKPDLASLYFTKAVIDRKSTRLNSSHGSISYAVFCLKKKKKNDNNNVSSNDQRDE